MKQAEAFALTSRYEGFNALLEAMAAGVPCLSVDCDSGPREIIRDGENGLLVPKDDPAALVAGLTRLLADTTLRTELSRTAPAVASTFTWDAFLSGYARTLVAACGDPRKGWRCQNNVTVQ
ncbi:MAG: glycosyltransferase [Pirellulaceae bacterium]